MSKPRKESPLLENHGPSHRPEPSRWPAVVLVLAAFLLIALGAGHISGRSVLAPPSWFFNAHQNWHWQGAIPWVLWRMAAALLMLAAVFAVPSAPAAVARMVFRVGAGRGFRRFLLGALLYLLFWHAALASHWSNDDFMNLSAVQQRLRTWTDYVRVFFWVDAVDGNYRPLATYLWLGGCLDVSRILGVDPETFSRVGQAFVLMFFTGMLARMAAGMGVGGLAAGVTAWFWLSRSSLFTVHHWTAAMGDVFSCLGQVAAFFFWWEYRKQRLRTEARGEAAGLPFSRLWVGALACHFLALLAKQSALVFPWAIFMGEWVLVGPVRPTVAGDPPGAPLSFPVRVWRACRETAPFAVLTIGIFILGQSIVRDGTPYPVTFDPYHLFASGAYFTWAVSGFLPFFWDPFQLLICIFAGWSLVLLLWWSRRTEWARCLTDWEGRVTRFGILAALPFWGLMTLMPNRFTPYYLAPALPWLCLSGGVVVRAWWRRQRGYPGRWRQLGIALALVACLGFLEGEGKRVDVFYSGGHPRGSGYFRFRPVIIGLSPHLKQATDTLVLIDFPVQRAWWAGLVRTYHPAVKRVLFADSGAGVDPGPSRPPLDWKWFHNGREGLFEVEARMPPTSGFRYYHWEEPLTSERARKILGDSAAGVTAVRFVDETRLLPANALLKGF